MNECDSTIRSSCLLLLLAAGLAACSGDGGTDPSWLYFSVNGRGECDDVVVEFERPPAVDEGSIDCVLDDLLDDAGCDIDVDELPGDVVRVELDGCEIDAVSRLFRCGFEEEMLAEVRTTAFAECDCDTPACSVAPPVCVGTALDSQTCEHCVNGLDDDGNGYVDCEDANCLYSSHCSFDPVTTSTVSSTSSTIAALSTSTTSLPSPSEYAVTFALDDASGISSLEVVIDYGEALARAASPLSSPSCSGANLPGDAEYSYDDANEKIYVSVTDLDADGPVELAECTFETGTPPVAEDFAIEVTEALDEGGEPVSEPEVVVSDVRPAPPTTTTTTTTTTSSTTTSSTTTTTRPPFQDAYTVEFRMLTSSDVIGALQWSVDYSSATGEFRGKGALVECFSGIADVLFAANDVAYCSLEADGITPCNPAQPGACWACSRDSSCEAAESGLDLGTCSIVDVNLLRIGVVGAVPFGAPKIVAQCAFDGTPDDPPVPADFPIELVDVTDDEGEPASVTMDVTVTAPASP